MNNENENKFAVIHIGGLDDCKFVLATLKSVGIDPLLDVAEKFGARYANKGYYVVAVSAEQLESAKTAIEKQLRSDLKIEETDELYGGLQNCPACGAEISEQHKECPECGINFE